MRPLKRAAKEIIRGIRSENSSQFSSIPEHILEDILIRVGNSKALNDYKFVCKQWNSIISKPYFINRCIADFNDNNDKYFIIIAMWNIYSQETGTNQVQFRTRFFSLTMNYNKSTEKTKKSLEWFKLDFLNLKSSQDLFLQASYCDLLLLTHSVDWFHTKQCYIVNVFTRRWISLPCSPVFYCERQSSTSSGISSREGLIVLSSGMGQIRFKVIRIVYIKTFRIEQIDIFPIISVDDGHFCVQLYSSDNNEWEEYTLDWYSLRFSHFLEKLPIISHNGMFHWINGISLFSLNPFDLIIEDYVPIIDSDTLHVPHKRLRPTRIIDLPEKNLLPPNTGVESGNRNIVLGFEETGSHLRLITDHIYEDGTPRFLLVWQLYEDVGDCTKSWWTLLCKLPLDYTPEWKLNLLAFHPYQRNLVYLVSYDYIFQIHWEVTTSQTRIKSIKKPKLYRNFNRGIPPLLHQWFPSNFLLCRLYLIKCIGNLFIYCLCQFASLYKFCNIYHL